MLFNLVLALAVQQPVLFIVEDLHWSNPSTLEWLDLHVKRGPAAPILMLMTCRADFHPPWGIHEYVTHLTVNRLPPNRVTQMVASMRGEKTLPEALLQQVVAKTDGIPLFVEEVTKWVVEASLTTQHSAHVEAIAHLTQGLDLLTTLPATPKRAQDELTLLTRLRLSLAATKGYANPLSAGARAHVAPGGTDGLVALLSGPGGAADRASSRNRCSPWPGACNVSQSSHRDGSHRGGLTYGDILCLGRRCCISVSCPKPWRNWTAPERSMIPTSTARKSLWSSRILA